MLILLVVPDPNTSPKGRAVTAGRWGRILESLGHQVVLVSEHLEADGDLLIALHALRSAQIVEQFQAQCPDAPILLALTGTDIYGYDDLFGDHERAIAVASMELATRLIAFQPLAADEIPEHLRSKVRVIYSSAEVPKPPPGLPPTSFDVCVIADLRPFKDPFRAALAARRLPPTSVIRVLQFGRIPSDAVAQRAAKEEEANRRYSCLGEVPHSEVLGVLARSSLLVVASQYESGANIVAEALAAGVPILASRIPGNVGLLGEGYDGYFSVGDTDALAELMERCESDTEFYLHLKTQCEELRPLVDPERERQAWADLLAEVTD